MATAASAEPTSRANSGPDADPAAAPAGWSWPRRILTMLWIAVRLVVLVLLGTAGQKFFYEGF